jgi:hypothetical protein
MVHDVLSCRADRGVRQIEQLKRCEIIPEAAVKEICLKAKEILMEEGNVQYVDSPVTVSWLRLPQRRGAARLTQPVDMRRYTWTVL